MIRCCCVCSIFSSSSLDHPRYRHRSSSSSSCMIRMIFSSYVRVLRTVLISHIYSVLHRPAYSHKPTFTLTTRPNSFVETTLAPPSCHTEGSFSPDPLGFYLNCASSPLPPLPYLPPPLPLPHPHPHPPLVLPLILPLLALR